MKPIKYFLSAAAAILFAYASAPARTELPVSEQQPVLISKTDPVLGGIEPLCVVISHSGTELNKKDLLWRNLQRRVESDLKKAGIEVIAIPDENYPAEIPELRIAVDMLRHENSNRYFLHIQTSLARMVYLERGGSVSVKTEVWKIGPAMEATASENMQATVMRVATKQVEAFINSCLAANSAHKSSEPTITNVPQKPASAKFPYVASKNGKVFHKADCVWVSRIKAENLVGYNSREEALAAGKKPCRQCQP